LRNSSLFRVLGTLAVAAAFAVAGTALPSAGATATDPLAATLLTRPSPVLGTDKQRHVVYDFQLDNVTASRVRLERLQVVATSPPGVLASYRGDEIVPLLLVIGADQPTRTLEPGQTGFVFPRPYLSADGQHPPHLSTGLS
jgi:hypothetical protein